MAQVANFRTGRQRRCRIPLWLATKHKPEPRRRGVLLRMASTSRETNPTDHQGQAESQTPPAHRHRLQAGVWARAPFVRIRAKTSLEISPDTSCRWLRIEALDETGHCKIERRQEWWRLRLVQNATQPQLRARRFLPKRHG